MPCTFKSVTAIITAAAMLVGLAEPALAAPPTGTDTQPSPASIETCRGLSDDRFQTEINRITRGVLHSELGNLNYAALVETHWQKTDMDRRVDEQIDTAIAQVRADTNWLDRAYSTVSKETATKFAVEVAEKVYNSDEFRSAIANLTEAIGGDVGARIETAAAKIPGPVISCVQLALEARYGGAIAAAFSRHTQETVDSDTAEIGAAKIDTSDLVLQGGQAISGLILIMSRRLIARMVAQMGRRLAGAIATRIVSSFTGLVGLALIVKDIIDAGQGVFPLVAERMKSAESKQLIKDEIAKSISGYVAENVDTISVETASRMYAIWEDFKKQHDRLLALADKNEAFAALLKQVKLGDIGRLGAIVEIISENEGEASVFRRTGDGTLAAALKLLRMPGLTIAKQTRSLDTAIAWAKLAGNQIERVVKFDVYTHIAPEKIDRRQLRRLLAVDDAKAVSRLAALEPAARDQLLSLPPAELRRLARSLSEKELRALAKYQTELPSASARRMLNAVSEQPARMSSLARSSVQQAVLESADKAAAMDMLLDGGGYFSFFGLLDHFKEVRSGDVKARVFFEAYMVTLIIGAALLFILLMLILRLFRRPRTTVIVKTSEGEIKGRAKR